MPRADAKIGLQHLSQGHYVRQQTGRLSKVRYRGSTPSVRGFQAGRWMHCKYEQSYEIGDLLVQKCRCTDVAMPFAEFNTAQGSRVDLIFHGKAVLSIRPL